MSFKVISIHKEESLTYDKIQDKYSISNNKFCVSDGTTQGYDSGKFAEILSDNFTGNKIRNKDDFFKISLKTSKTFNNRKVKESGNKAIDKLREDKKKKGGSSTLIGCEIDEDKLHVLSYGDSMLFHLRDGNVIEKYPFNDSKELDESSFFINSNLEYDSELFNEDAIDFHEINLKKDDQIILSTDAISKYFLNNINGIDRFNEFNSFEKFKEFILTNWKDGNIERDDITILIYNHDDSSSIKKIIPSDDFKFKELETPKLNDTIDKNLKNLNRDKNNSLINQLVEKDEEIFYLRETNKNLKLYLSISLISIFIFVSFFIFMIFKSDNISKISDEPSNSSINGTNPNLPVDSNETIGNDKNQNRFEDITMNYDLDESQENPESSDETTYYNDDLTNENNDSTDLPNSGNSIDPQTNENNEPIDLPNLDNPINPQTNENNDSIDLPNLDNPINPQTNENDSSQEINNYSNDTDEVTPKKSDSTYESKPLTPIQLSSDSPITLKQLSNILTIRLNKLKRICEENNIPIENDTSELDKETIKSIFKLLDREVIFYNEEQNIINNKPDVDTIRIKN